MANESELKEEETTWPPGKSLRAQLGSRSPQSQTPTRVRYQSARGCRADAAVWPISPGGAFSWSLSSHPSLVASIPEGPN